MARTMRVWLLWTAVAAVLAAGGCRGGGDSMTFVDAGAGVIDGAAPEYGLGPQCVVVRSQAAWAALSGTFRVNPAISPARSEEILRGVDFTRQSIVIVTLGQKPSTGYAIRLRSIEPGPPVKLVMTSSQPAPGAMAGAAMTHPFHAVVVDATSLPADAGFELDGKRVEVERGVRE